MKKVFTLLCAAALCGITAQAEKSWCLQQITCEWAFETTDYYYNDMGLVTQAVIENNDTRSNSYYANYTYDGGNLIKVEEFQDAFEEFDLDKYLPVNYVEYKYNSLNQRVERRNFNNWRAKEHPDEPNFILGAVMIYEYNMNGTLDKVTTYWDNNLTRLHQVDNYIYNDKGLLVKRELSMADFQNNLTHNVNVNYIYDEGDQLIEVQQCQYDEATDHEEIEYCNVYTYDAQGNMTSDSKMTASKMTVKHKFEYNYVNDVDGHTIDDISYPIDYEEERQTTLFQGLRHVLDSYSEWDTDTMTDQLVKFDTFHCHYGVLRETGIKNVDAARPEAIGLTFAGVTGNRLMLRGIEAMDNVRVYDMEGRQLISDAYTTSGIDVTNLPAGAYIVSTANGAAKFVK